MNIPYEILIRGENGVFKGAHAIDTPSGAARPVKSEDWPVVAKAINDAALTRVKELEILVETKDNALADAQAVVAEATKIVLDPDISDEDTVNLLKAKIEAQTLPGMIESAEKELAAAQEKLDALKKKE